MAVTSSIKTDFSDKKVLIFGLGLQGRGIGDAKFFKGLGCQVRATDLKTGEQLASSLDSLSDYNLEYSLGGHKNEDIEWADIIIRNAAVKLDSPFMQYAQSLQKPIHMDTDLFMRYVPKEVTTIGVTGTRGKTTTATLIYSLLKNLEGKQVFLSGNVSGVATLSLLEQITDPINAIVVLELSSWQLQGFHQAEISPHIAVVTNIYPDHLNYYKTMEEYVFDKTAITKYQNNNNHLFIQNQQNLTAFLKTNAQIHYYQISDVDNYHLSLPGAHNKENASAAKAIALHFNVPENTIQSVLESFTPVPYRLETVAIINNITYINDTTSTTPIATIKALESITPPVHLIAGGHDKNLPLEDLAQAINSQVKFIYLLSGSGTDKIKSLINPQQVAGEFDSLESAVNTASVNAKDGEVVLLSPGFASFGMFVNEFDRGDQFNQLVKT